MHSKNDAEQVKNKAAVGAAVDTDIAVAGIMAEDLITAVIDLTGHADLDPAAFAVTADDVIQSATVDTTGMNLLVTYVDKSAG